MMKNIETVKKNNNVHPYNKVTIEHIRGGISGGLKEIETNSHLLMMTGIIDEINHPHRKKPVHFKLHKAE